MWIFLFLFFAVSAGFTILSLSLSSSDRIIILGASIISVVMLISYPFTLKLTNKTFLTLLESPNLVSSVALLQIFESIVILGISILHIRDHYQAISSAKKIITYLNLLPSFVFFVGLCFLQSYSFLHLEGISYRLMAILFSFAVFLIIIGSTMSLKIICPQWDLRAELKVLTSLFQILLSMFLPLIVKGVQVPFTNLVLDATPALLTALVIFIFSMVGMLLYFRKENLTIKRFPK